MSTVHIDVGAILRASLDGVYTDLVTRATGRTVRTQIEECVATGEPGALAVIDFSNVRLLDFSCADEIVATLMRSCCAESTEGERYLLFAGITDGHLDAIEHVLERHGLALVVRFTGLGGPQLVGVVDATERAIWEAVARLQPADADAVVAATGFDEATVAACLALLHDRRLLIRRGADYSAPIGALA